MIRLLHADDEEDIREIVQLALELSEEFEIVQCASGAEAMLAAEKFRPEVLLLDVMMPGMSGPRALEKIRGLPGLENVPAIFLTALSSFHDTKELWDLGALDVISKPFRPMLLGQQIKAAMNRMPK